MAPQTFLFFCRLPGYVVLVVTIDASLREAIEFSIELRGIRVSFAWLPEVERANRSVPGNSWKMVHPHTPLPRLEWMFIANVPYICVWVCGNARGFFGREKSRGAV